MERIMKAAPGDRKDRSLGALCCRFMAHFQSGEKDLICLDQAASDLGVERRRIYDVINILEALEVVSRKEKNYYRWHGLGSLSTSMQHLRALAVAEQCVPLPEVEEEVAGMGPRPSLQAARDTVRAVQAERVKYRSEDSSDKRERSMGALAQRFLQLFLVGRRSITLEFAADCLMEGDGTAKMKTRVRRLYDIANVLCMLRIVEKEAIPGTRKPLFLWVGVGSIPDFTQFKSNAPGGGASVGGTFGAPGAAAPPGSPQHPPPPMRHPQVRPGTACCLPEGAASRLTCSPPCPCGREAGVDTPYSWGDSSCVCCQAAWWCQPTWPVGPLERRVA